MRDILKIDAKAVAFGSGAFFLLFLLVVVVFNAVLNFTGLSRLANIAGASAFLPFLMAGYLTALRTHPSGVANSVCVGVIAGTFNWAVIAAIFGTAHTKPGGLSGTVTTSIALCALGGLLGAIAAHYRKTKR